MRETDVKKLAGVLKGLVTAAFVCNLLTLFFVPALVVMKQDWITLLNGSLLLDPAEPVPPLLAAAAMWPEVFRRGIDQFSVLTAFLLLSGCCTAVILWQGRRVLNAILRGEPFSLENAASLKRAAVCAFLISAAALCRVGWSCWFYRSAAPLATYNALFVPIFLMAGLLLVVLSALLRQAAELKAENDLTI